MIEGIIYLHKSTMVTTSSQNVLLALVLTSVYEIFGSPDYNPLPSHTSCMWPVATGRVTKAAWHL